MLRWFVSLTCLSCLLLAGGDALAQYSVPSQAASSGRVGTARSKVREELVSTRGWEMGASLNFLTSEPSIGGEDLKFTDMVLLRLHGLISLGGAVELFAGTDVLPKQPSYTDELAWQGALGGARFKLGESFAAWVRASTGPQIAQTGWWASADAAVQYKLALEKILFFETALGDEGPVWRVVDVRLLLPNRERARLGR